MTVTVKPGLASSAANPRELAMVPAYLQLKHILVPVWLMTYSYGRRAYQVVVNGVTGQMAGGRPWSWIKITLLVIVVLIIAGLIISNQ